MSVFPVINGSGKPRLILIQKDIFYTSIGATTFAATTVTEAEGSTTAISTSGTGNPGTINATAHGKAEGDWIRIAGHSGSTPNLNAKWRVLAVPNANSLQIGVNITVGGTGGTLQKTPAFAGRGFAVGRRIAIEPTTNQALKYGKLTTIDDANNVLTVDSWYAGTPTNGSAFKVDGWIADLPYCNDLTERFEPDVLVHNLWRSRKKSKHYGWKYQCSLDYSKGIVGDTFLLIAPHLNMRKEDRLILIPRVDKPEFNYNVFFSESFDLSQLGQGLGHTKPIFTLTGKELVSSFPIISGYGTNYANNYGIGE